MIALNELLDNIDEFSYKYKEKGVRFNPSFFVKSYEKLKNIQLKLESDRATCNKLCASLTEKRLKNEDTNDLLHEILTLDKVINKESKLANKQIKVINKKLKKLHNLPTCTNQFNEQIDFSKKEISKNELLNLIQQNINFDKLKISYEKYMKQQKDKIFNESDFPSVVMCKNKLVFSCTQEQLEDIKNKFLEYFKVNSFSIIKLSVKKLKKDNAEEYFVHISRTKEIGIYIVTDYHTRNYKVKYKDSKSDMTKFVYQLILTF